MAEQSVNISALSSKTIKGTLWSYASRYSGKLMVFISTIILARLLTEEEFGVAGYALVFISFLEMLRGLGVGTALIYFPEESERTYTGFWLILAIGITLCLATWLIAPWVGVYFNDARAVDVVRAMGFTFPLNAIGITHDSLLRKHLAFNKRFAPDFARSLSKGLVSILLALLGFGVWSLIFGHLAGAAVAAVTYWIVLKWRPRFLFSLQQGRELIQYGMKVVSADFLAVFLNNLDYLLIGRYLGAAALGVYTIAFRIPEITIKQFYILTGQVIFPTFTKVQGDRDLLRQGFQVTLRYMALVTAPLGVGLALLSRPFVLVFLTEKWSEAITVIPAIAIYTVLRAVGFAAGDIYKAVGRPEILTRIKLAQTVVTLPALWWAVTVAQTIEAVGWAQVGISLFAAVISLIVVNRVLEISFRKIFEALYPALLGCTIMGLVVAIIVFATESVSPLLQLIAGVGGGGLTYMAILWWQQREVVMLAVRTIKSAFGPKNPA